MFVVEGIHTSIPLQQRVLHDPDFLAGNFDTNFIKRFMPAEQPKKASGPAVDVETGRKSSGSS
jgi:acetyl-CoA carboxylase biotin carboxylase subunit